MARKKKVVTVEVDDFRQVQNWITVFKNQIIEVADPEMEKLSRSFAWKVRTILYQQQYSWKPLSERYLAYKRRKKLDERILIATKTYVQSIQAQPLKRRTSDILTWRVGPGQMNEVHRPSGLKFKQLARLLEFGSKSKKLPARPHWRPAWSAFIRSDKKKRFFRKIVRKAIKQAGRTT